MNKQADYAVVTGVQVHSWARTYNGEFRGVFVCLFGGERERFERKSDRKTQRPPPPKKKGDEPNLEFIAPTTVYTCVNGQRTYLDLREIPAMTPRQLKALASADAGGGGGSSSGGGGGGGGSGGHGSHGGHASGDNRLASGGTLVTTVVEESKSHSVSHRKAGSARFKTLLKDNAALEVETSCPWPSWQTRIRSQSGRREEDSSCNLDESFDEEEEDFGENEF